jgi:hypothetical protein
MFPEHGGGGEQFTDLLGGQDPDAGVFLYEVVFGSYHYSHHMTIHGLLINEIGNEF